MPARFERYQSSYCQSGRTHKIRSRFRQMLIWESRGLLSTECNRISRGMSFRRRFSELYRLANLNPPEDRAPEGLEPWEPCRATKGVRHNNFRLHFPEDAAEQLFLSVSGCSVSPQKGSSKYRSRRHSQRTLVPLKQAPLNGESKFQYTDPGLYAPKVLLKGKLKKKNLTYTVIHTY